VNKHAFAYLRLMRLDKPIGIYLILWPTLTALWLAAGGIPPITMIIIFVLGTVVMRSAGCVINDIADRNFDRHVARTQQRPITQGVLSVRQALGCLVVLLCIALYLVLQLPIQCFYLAWLALGITGIYPFTKRFLHAPQLILGLAFSTAVPMAFFALNQPLGKVGWCFYVMTLVWPIVYDTMYAMVDRVDDLKLGIRSTAIWFGRFDRLVLGILQFVLTMLCVLLGGLAHLAWPYFLGVLVVALLFMYQQVRIRLRAPDACFQAFLNNHWALLVLWLGVVAP